MAIINALSPSKTDIQKAITDASDGDIVQVPKGEVTWLASETLTMNKYITLIGNGGAGGMDEAHDPPTAANATIIHLARADWITCTFPGGALNDWPARISGFVLELTVSSGTYAITAQGRCFRHRDGSNQIVGGLRIDHMRFRGSVAIGNGAHICSWGGPNAAGAKNYVTGSFDHNFLDYPVGAFGSEVFNLCNTGSPTGTIVGGVEVQNGTYPDRYGEYAYSQDYTYGGGDDTEFQVLYIEDNIFHRGGTNGTTLGGGARLVFRHNTMWGSFQTHGFDSGGNVGPPSYECYNNLAISHITPTPNWATFNWRGGACVSFNNRATGWSPTGISPWQVQVSRPSASGTNIAGPATGRNYFDENWRDDIPQSANVNGTPGFFYPAIDPSPSDLRVGSKYAEGTITAANGNVLTLSNLDGTASTIKWKDFVVVDIGLLPDAAADQSVLAEPEKSGYGLIKTNTTNSTTSTQVTCWGGANGTVASTVGHQYEIRRVKKWFNTVGAGKIPPLLNGGSNHDTPSIGGLAFTTPVSGNNKYWSNQAQYGCFNWDNQYRANSGASFTTLTLEAYGNCPLLAVAGGIHDGVAKIPKYKKNDGPGDTAQAGVGGYPQIADNDSKIADYKRIGADWVAPNWASEFVGGTAYPPAPAHAYGALYPNAMVTPPVNSLPAFTSTASTSFTAGVASTYTVTASGVPSPTFSIVSGSQSWLSIGSTTGILAATTSSVAGTYNNIVIRASNTQGTADQTFTLTVDASVVPPTIPSTDSTTFVEGTASTYDITGVTGSTPITYSLVQITQTIPTWLSIGSSTGILAATASSLNGSYVFTVRAHNTGGNADQTFTLTVSAVGVTLLPPTIIVSG